MNNIYRPMNHVATFIVAILVFSSISFVSQALPPPPIPKDLFVDDSGGNNSNDCLTSITACLTIVTGGGAALTKANSGDTIYIAAGTYPESVQIGTKLLTLIGEDVSTTIIDATGLSTALLIYGGHTISVSNITFSNGTNYNISLSDEFTALIARNIRIIDSVGTGIFANDGSVDIKNVEISGNGNQGIHLNPNVTTASVVNATISGNTDFGIGTASGAVLNITNSTITNNGKAGLSLNTVTNIQNTIVAANDSTNMINPVECYGTVNSLGNNISRDGTSIGGVCSFDQPGDWANTDPLVEPLDFNGAGTKTHALNIMYSVAINGGSKSGCPIDDQRGVLRDQSGFNILKAQGGNTIVIPQDDGCDIGAYETNS